MSSSSSSSSLSSSAPIAASASVSSIVSSFHESISTIPSVSLIPADRPFYFLSSSNSLRDALQLLSARGILSAPVFDISKEICLGSCSLLTIATFLVKNKNILQEKEKVEKELLQVKLSQVMAAETETIHHSRATLATMFEENPLSLLIDYFQTRGVHRVALISKSCELKHPCSQSDVISWLCKQFNEKKYLQLSHLTISEVITHLDSLVNKNKNSLSYKKPICVNESNSVISALDLMNHEHISCVGVLNNSGQLIASFSSTDLRGLTDFQCLFLSVFDYLKKYSSSSLSPLFIHSSTTFSSFLFNLHLKKVHRGWLVDDEMCPIRLLTLSDIIQFLASGNKVTEETANGGKDVKKLWTAKLMDAGKPVDSSHLFKQQPETETSTEGH